MTEEKITLDREVFKTLASGTRVDILKSLDRRRKTLTELSREFGMSVSAVKEHLDNLVKVGLIEQKDEGHKWKYYELTRKGRGVLHPEDKKIWILLGISGIAFIGIAYDLLRTLSRSVISAGAPQTVLRETAATAPSAGGGGETFVLAPHIPYLHIAGLIVFGLIMIASFVYIRRGRKNIEYRI